MAQDQVIVWILEELGSSWASWQTIPVVMHYGAGSSPMYKVVNIN